MKSHPLAGTRLTKNGLSPWLVKSMVLCIVIGGVLLRLWTPAGAQAVEGAASQPIGRPL